MPANQPGTVRETLACVRPVLPLSSSLQTGRDSLSGDRRRSRHFVIAMLPAIRSRWLPSHVVSVWGYPVALQREGDCRRPPSSVVLRSKFPAAMGGLAMVEVQLIGRQGLQEVFEESDLRARIRKGGAALGAFIVARSE